jgi:predicted aspartyl protease
MYRKPFKCNALEPQVLLVEAFATKTNGDKEIVKAVLDTGSSACVLPKGWKDQILKERVRNRTVTIDHPGLPKEKIDDVYSCTIGLEGGPVKTVETVFYDKVDKLIIGLSWMNMVHTVYYRDSQECILEIKEPTDA